MDTPPTKPVVSRVMCYNHLESRICSFIGVKKQPAIAASHVFLGEIHGEPHVTPLVTYFGRSH